MHPDGTGDHGTEGAHPGTRSQMAPPLPRAVQIPPLDRSSHPHRPLAPAGDQARLSTRSRQGYGRG